MHTCCVHILKLVRNTVRYSCQNQRTVQLVLLRGKAKFSSDVLSDAVNSLDNTTPVKHAALSILHHETFSNYFSVYLSPLPVCSRVKSPAEYEALCMDKLNGSDVGSWTISHKSLREQSRELNNNSSTSMSLSVDKTNYLLSAVIC